MLITCFSIFSHFFIIKLIKIIKAVCTLLKASFYLKWVYSMYAAMIKEATYVAMISVHNFENVGIDFSQQVWYTHKISLGM